LIKRYPVILEMWKENPVKMLEEAEHKAGKKLEGFKLSPISEKIAVTEETSE